MYGKVVIVDGKNIDLLINGRKLKFSKGLAYSFYQKLEILKSFRL